LQQVGTIGRRIGLLLGAVNAEVVSASNPYQSGFQPTVEPTGFQPVVVQFTAIASRGLRIADSITSRFAAGIV
jgi:hypothetical protein